MLQFVWQSYWFLYWKLEINYVDAWSLKSLWYLFELHTNHASDELEELLKFKTNVVYHWNSRYIMFYFLLTPNTDLLHQVEDYNRDWPFYHEMHLLTCRSSFRLFSFSVDTFGYARTDTREPWNINSYV